MIRALLDHLEIRRDVERLAAGAALELLHELGPGWPIS